MAILLTINSPQVFPDDFLEDWEPGSLSQLPHIDDVAFRGADKDLALVLRVAQQLMWDNHVLAKLYD